MTPKPYAIYTRLSVDRDGEQTATQRQEADARRLARERGLRVGRVFSDVDLSAYDKRVRRPGFEAMLDALRDGDFGGVLVWKMDRLVRQPRDLERVLDALEAHAAGLVSVHDPVDVSGPMGVAMVRIGVVMASVESANISVRVKRKAEETARAGRPSGGGTRPFGYAHDRSAIVEVEAELIRDAAERVLEGESVRAVARDWNERGVRTPTGGEWRANVLARLLRAGLIAGLREHHGEIVADGTWPAIITRDQHERLRVMLDPRNRRTTGGTARSYLLTGGLARCGVCGAQLVARPRDDGRRRYVCAKAPGLPGCGRITTLAEPVEQVVAEAVLTRLASPVFARLLRESARGDELGVLTRDLVDAESRLEDLAADYASGVISRTAYHRARSVADERITKARRGLDALQGSGILHALPSGEDRLRGVWERGGLDWRRRVLAAVLEGVTVAPAVRGRNWFDPTRLHLAWLDAGEQPSDAA